MRSCFARNIEAALVHGFLDVRGHVDRCGPVADVRDLHSEELVVAAAGFGHGAETLFEEGDDIGDDGWVDMGNFHVVDVPGDRALGAVDCGIGNTEVVGVHCETAGGEDGGEQFVPKEAAHDASVDGLE